MNIHSISIDTDLEENQYIISGDVKVIQNHKRAKENFKAIDALFENNKIYVPFSTEDKPNQYDDKELQYQSILEIFKDFDIKKPQETEETKKFVANYKQENKNFEEFSQKAKNIRNSIHEINSFKNLTKTISNNLTRTLYPLQLLSAYHLAFAQNACNFSVPGAGKTSIVYGAYAYLKSLEKDDVKHINRLLIISPLAAFAPWKNEYQECFGKKTTVKELVGIPAADRKNHFLIGDEEITLISYQSASNESDVEAIKNFLKRKENKVMVVLDEAHRIKNVEGGKWAKAVLSIAKYAKSRIVLTGTPAPNGYQDLHNLYKFIWPQKDIVKYPIYYLQSLSDNSYTPQAKSDINTLIDRISPFFIRIKKSHLKLNPPCINKPIMVGMSQSQKTIYDYIEEKYIDYFENQVSSDNFINKLKKAKLIRLMQAMTNPNLLNKPLDNYLNEEGLSNNLNLDDRGIIKLIKNFNPLKEVLPKFKAILKIIQENIIKKSGADGKVVIWTIFIQNIFDLKKFLSSHNINCEVLYGKTPNENEDTPEDILTREKVIKQFHQKNCRYKVIIANPFAVGESISLHKACHNAIYLEKNFNAAIYMQSKDRVHRYGLSENDIINYYYVLTENTIDQTIHNRLIEKEDRMLEIIEQEIPLLSLDMDSEDNEEQEDIKAIIKDYYARKAIKIS